MRTTVFATLLRTFLGLSMILTSHLAMANDYIIFSISHEIPMGEKGEKLRKNYYINMGSAQGLKKGALVDVYRTISQLDPYNSNKRYHFKIKVGQVEVLHVEETASITQLVAMSSDPKTPMVELNGLLIGDQVDINLE